ncbi:MAG: hypothetical protein C4531_04135 [Desulfurivibrio sp.]|jgi:adenine-specific DNA-methyltransferase|nr:MAG: hypothetical protein C4531_04135 [Desulfurivibrio sp.]
MTQKTTEKLTVDSITHDEATRKNIPTAEHQSIMHEADKSSVRVTYERRKRDLDPKGWPIGALNVFRNG